MTKPIPPERLAEIRAVCSAASWWESLDMTPMMPESKADPAYGGADHRFLALARAAVPELLAEIARCHELLNTCDALADDVSFWLTMRGSSMEAHWLSRVEVDIEAYLKTGARNMEI